MHVDMNDAWVETDSSCAIRDRLTELLSAESPRHLIVCVAPGFGSTALINELLLEARAPAQRLGADQMRTPTEVARAILDAIGMTAAWAARTTAAQAELQAVSALRAHGVRLLLVDDACSLARSRSPLRVCATLERITAAAGVQLVLFGQDEELSQVLANMPSIVPNCDRAEYAPWGNDAEFRDFLLRYQETVPCDVRPDFDDDECLSVLRDRTDGSLAAITRLVRGATDAALNVGAHFVDIRRSDFVCIGSPACDRMMRAV